MEDTLISFETAKLAKEKGFKDIIGVINGKHYYNYKKELDGDQFDYIKARLKKENLTLVDNYPAPTQSLLQKWLRDKHKIFVSVGPWFGRGIEYKYDIQEICVIGYWKMNLPEVDDDKEFDSYEQALEAGLQEALKLIK